MGGWGGLGLMEDQRLDQKVGDFIELFDLFNKGEFGYQIEE